MKQKFQQPILIVSAPRSGSSLLSYILHESGVQVGVCKPADEFNQKGYFENLRIRKAIIKYLKQCDTQNLGKKYQPINLRESYKDFDRKVYRALRQEGFVKDKPWLFKDPKIALCWNLFNVYYPDAKWILLYRNDKDVLASYERATFMDAYETKKEWTEYLNCWKMNMKSIKAECNNVFEMNIESIFNNDEQVINAMYEFCGVENINAHKSCVDTKLFVTT